MVAPRSFQLAAITHQGLVRSNNEDSFASPFWSVNDCGQAKEQASGEIGTGPVPVVVLADGMGGHRAGEVASRMVVEGLLQPPWSWAMLSDPEAALCRRIEAVHQAIDKASIDQLEFFGMGSTLAGLLLNDQQLVAFNVGDSRIYRFAEQRLQQISEDHSLGQGRSHVLTQALGGTHPPEPSFSLCRLQAGDRFLLCSDGLSDVVDDEMIAACLRQGDAAADALISLALEAGAPDNVTVMVLDLVEA